MNGYLEAPPVDPADAAVAGGDAWAVAYYHWCRGEYEEAADAYAAAARHFDAAGMPGPAAEARHVAAAQRAHAERRAAWDYAKNYGGE